MHNPEFKIHNFAIKRGQRLFAGFIETRKPARKGMIKNCPISVMDDWAAVDSLARAGCGGAPQV